MAEVLSCFRCGASLESLSLPLSIRDECPACAIHLHVCRMCEFFAADKPRQCREDDAEEVADKEKLNFCEWFSPRSGAFDALRAHHAREAASELAGLFGEQEKHEDAADPLLQQARDLFE